MSEFETGLRDYLVNEARLDGTGLQPATPLFSSGALNSFAMIELVSYLETACNFRVKAREITLQNFDSIEKILAFVKKKTAG